MSDEFTKRPTVVLVLDGINITHAIPGCNTYDAYDIKTVHDCIVCTIRRLSQTFSLVVPFVILFDITHALQMAIVFMVAHIFSL